MATWSDLSSQYYLPEKSLGANRAEASIHSLAELNDSVTVHCIAQPLTEKLVAKYDVSCVLFLLHVFLDFIISNYLFYFL